MHYLSAVFLVLSFGLLIVHALPTWEGLNTWSANIGTLVPGATYIEALGSDNGGLYNEQRSYHFLSVATEAPGKPLSPTGTLNYISSLSLVPFRSPGKRYSPSQHVPCSLVPQQGQNVAIQ